MKRLMLFVCLLIHTAAYTLTAQTNYYQETKVFHLEDCIYQCERPETGRVIIYNKANTLRNEPMYYKGTKHVYGTPENEDIPVLDEANFYTVHTQCKTIVQEVFNKHRNTLNQERDMSTIFRFTNR